MLIQEFESLTGIYPSSSLYEQIEAVYTDFDGDKAAFCKAYKANKDGLAEAIQRWASLKDIKAADDAEKRIKGIEAEIEKLKTDLEREQEWKLYVDENNYPQTRYDELKLSGGTRVLTDEEAKDLLYNWYGFAREKIKIYHAIPAFEVNRHRYLRKVGEIERLPLYNVTDWNYIRFDCGCMSYELINDDLRPFLH